MAATLLVLVAVIVVLLTVWFLKHEKLKKIIDKIPGPSALPVIGNAHQLKHTNKEFFEQMLAYGKEYADKGIMRLWLGVQPMVIVYKAEYVEVLLNSSKHLDKSQDYRFLHPWLGTGLLTSTGLKWKTRRRMLTPTFHFKILYDFVSVFNDQAAVMMNNLKKREDQKEFNIFPNITACALDIICETAMGRHVNAQGNSDSDYVHAVYRISEIIQQRQKRPWVWPDAVFYTIGDGKEHDKCLNILHSFTEKVIRERSEEFSRSKANGVTMEDIVQEREDEDTTYLSKDKRLAFLDMLLCVCCEGQKLSFEDIREEVDTFMFEGHDTTAAAMSWAIHLIGSHPHIQDKLHQELDNVFGDSDRPATMKDLKEMKYLECCIKEALRIFPSVPFFARCLTEDADFGEEYRVPKGSTGVVLTVCLHKDPKYFPDPDKFDPDRFSDMAAKRHPFAYVPFSAGPRNCIGQKFALLEEKVLLSSIFRQYSVVSKQKREDLCPVGDLILRPESGVIVELKQRKSK